LLTSSTGTERDKFIKFAHDYKPGKRLSLSFRWKWVSTFTCRYALIWKEDWKFYRRLWDWTGPNIRHVCECWSLPETSVAALGCLNRFKIRVFHLHVTTLHTQNTTKSNTNFIAIYDLVQWPALATATHSSCRLTRVL